MDEHGPVQLGRDTSPLWDMAGTEALPIPPGPADIADERIVSAGPSGQGSLLESELDARLRLAGTAGGPLTAPLAHGGTSAGPCCVCQSTGVHSPGTRDEDAFPHVGLCCSASMLAAAYVSLSTAVLDSLV